MRYPKECFCINENVTENAKREYELKKNFGTIRLRNYILIIGI